MSSELEPVSGFLSVWYLWKAELGWPRCQCPCLSTERPARPWPRPADSYRRESFHTREETQEKQESHLFFLDSALDGSIHVERKKVLHAPLFTLFLSSFF